MINEIEETEKEAPDEKISIFWVSVKEFQEQESGQDGRMDKGIWRSLAGKRALLQNCCLVMDACFLRIGVARHARTVM